MNTLTAPIAPVAGWERAAVCRSNTADLWYSDNAADQHEASRTCGTCPVRLLCLDDALATEGSASARYRFGIRGGRTPEQRADDYQQRAGARTRNTNGHGGARHRAECGTPTARRRHRKNGEACDRCDVPLPSH